MDKRKIKALLKFYKCKLKNKYYNTEEERIRLEERIEHYSRKLEND